MHFSPVPRPEQAHTRLTRDGNEYLEVDIPPYGISSSTVVSLQLPLRVQKVVVVVVCWGH